MRNCTCSVPFRAKSKKSRGVETATAPALTGHSTWIRVQCTLVHASASPHPLAYVVCTTTCMAVCAIGTAWQCVQLADFSQPDGMLVTSHSAEKQPLADCARVHGNWTCKVCCAPRVCVFVCVCVLVCVCVCVCAYVCGGTPS